jgi:hypothetical protein
MLTGRSRMWVALPIAVEIFLISTASLPAVGARQSLIHWVPRPIFLVVRQSPSDAEVIRKRGAVPPLCRLFTFRGA